MKFENTFEVPAPMDEVWSTLMDIERVAPCMPGAEVLEHTSEDAFKVGVKVKLGPISMLYRGQVEIVERDDSAHHAAMRAKAKEARGQGTADARIEMSLERQPSGTRATIATDVALSGRAAAMGQGVIADVSAKLVEEFAGNLAAMLGEGGDAAPEPPAAGGPAPATAAAASAAAATEAPSGTTTRATANGNGAASQTESAPPPRAAAQSSLPVGKIAASVIADRLANPRTLLLSVLGLALVFGGLGYLLGKTT